MAICFLLLVIVVFNPQSSEVIVIDNENRIPPEQEIGTTILKDVELISSDDESKLEPSAPIHINNNWTEAKKAEICQGEGTHSDPYVIKNYEINASGHEHGILIENSHDVYFKIQNCRIYSAGDGEWDFPEEAGINIYNSKNGILIKNNCSYNEGNGINLVNCNNITLKFNVVFNNLNDGIFLFNGHNNTLFRNIANLNDQGIYSRDCDNNTISWNEANDNFEYNIRIRGSDDNVLLDNSATNGIYGLFVQNCHRAKIYNNSAFENTIGFGAKDSNKVKVNNGNKFNKNSKHGAHLMNCEGCEIIDTTLNENDESGIFLEHCNDTIIVDNNNSMNYNGLHGIHLAFSNNSLISKNSINNNPVGILLNETKYNIVTENTLIDNGQGIIDEDGYSNDIYGNDIGTSGGNGDDPDNNNSGDESDNVNSEEDNSDTDNVNSGDDNSTVIEPVLISIGAISGTFIAFAFIVNFYLNKKSKLRNFS